jgi:5'-deoxynucleotidase YfbR-like HD superfamily hydrolase
MDNIIKLFNLLQITRTQPQYGYAMGGGNIRIGNIAEHHYLVAMIGWQLCEVVNKKGAKVDTFKVIKYCLLHDIGETFGGDIGMYYAKANPKAKEYAKLFEEENQKFISQFFFDPKEIKELSKEILDSRSDEAHIAKIADFFDHPHYKFFNGVMKRKDIEIVAPRLKEKVAKIKNPIARKELGKLVEVWRRTMLTYDSYLDASADALGV